MPRYVAFLRGVSPMNAKMPELKACFEASGFADVRTVLASGNVAFGSRAATNVALARRIEAALQKQLGRTFVTIVRPSTALRELLDSDPFAPFALPAGVKRVVTFLREPRRAGVPLPIEADGVRVLATNGSEVFTAYVPSARGAVFMTTIEKAFGTALTTRTWESVAKCAAA